MIHVWYKYYIHFDFSARKQFGCDAYERVERSDVVFCRPVCLVGPGSDNVADIISIEDGYTHCESVEQVLAVCVKVCIVGMQLYSNYNRLFPKRFLIVFSVSTQVSLKVYNITKYSITFGPSSARMFSCDCF